MRTIKFRAWHEASKTMFDWDDISLNGRNNCVIHVSEGVFTTRKIDDNSVNLIQYTGISDINGYSIYEGDIVRATITDHGSKIEAIAVIVFKKGQFTTSNGEVNTWVSKKIEVIGNIYQNKDLIK